MASLTFVFVLLLASLLCCGRVSYINSRGINHVEALPLSGQQRQVGVQQPDKRSRLTSSDITVQSEDTEKRESGERMTFPVKRLVGLLRCSGWGPSCSWGDYSEPRLRSKQPSRGSSDAVHGADESSTRSVTTKTAARDRRPTFKFQPFFTLTSGKDGHMCRIINEVGALLKMCASKAMYIATQLNSTWS